MDKYEFGKCDICGKDKALRDDVCFECADKIELPEFFRNLFDKDETK